MRGANSTTGKRPGRFIAYPLLFLALGRLSPAVAESLDFSAFVAIVKSLSPLTVSPIVLQKPGMLIAPLYDHNDPDHQYGVASQFNAMLKPSLIYSAASRDLGEVYADILTNQQWAKTPLVPGQLADLNKLRVKLFKADGTTPTTGYATYLEKKAAYAMILAQYDATPEDQRTPELNANKEAAADALSLAGEATFGPQESRYQLLTEAASLVWRDTDRDRLPQSESSSSGRTFLRTETFPALDQVVDFNWTNITLSSLQPQMPDALPPFSGALLQRTPAWWSWSAAGPSATACPTNLTDSNFTVRFDVTSVQVRRDWLDTKVFDSQAWRWKNATQTELLSDGTQDANSGLAPLYPSSVLIVRDLTISGPALLPCLPAIREAVKNQQIVGFGPFTIAGSSSSPSPFYLPPIITTSSVHVSYPQVIAYGVNALPKTPNPNPDFVW